MKSSLEQTSLPTAGIISLSSSVARLKRCIRRRGKIRKKKKVPSDQVQFCESLDFETQINCEVIFFPLLRLALLTSGVLYLHN